MFVFSFVYQGRRALACRLLCLSLAARLILPLVSDRLLWVSKFVRSVTFAHRSLKCDESIHYKKKGSERSGWGNVSYDFFVCFWRQFKLKTKKMANVSTKDINSLLAICTHLNTHRITKLNGINYDFCAKNQELCQAKPRKTNRKDILLIFFYKNAFKTHSTVTCDTIMMIWKHKKTQSVISGDCICFV